MSYTFYIADAFHKTTEESLGYDYITAEELLKRIADSGVGRVRVDNEGNLVYESRFHREA
jgi:hypothetical protein